MDRRILEGDDIYARRCSAKLSFRSRAAVRKWIRQHSADRLDALNAYECAYCGQWHMTKNTPRESG